jgi:Cysteine dioxygenase type I
VSLTRFSPVLISDDPSARQALDVSAHPSAPKPSDPIRPVGSLSFRALRTIAARLARVEGPLPVDRPGDGARSSRLIATAFYDVWLTTWPNGSDLEPHDHGDVRSVLQVIDGELTEAYSDRPMHVEAAVRTLKRGSVTVAEPTVVHSLSNRSGRDATTLHVYSPPLIDVTFFDLHPTGEFESVHSSPAIGKPAQATSKGEVVRATAPLALVRP